MGGKIEQMDVPICNSFRPKIVKDQLCYTVDPNKYRDSVNIQREKLGLSLFINYNEDRQISSSPDNKNYSSNDYNIRIETIGKIRTLLMFSELKS